MTVNSKIKRKCKVMLGVIDNVQQKIHYTSLEGVSKKSFMTNNLRQ